MSPVTEPAWSGLTYIVGSDKHVMPLREDDKDHVLSPDCPCEPVGPDTTWPLEDCAPPFRVYKHLSVTEAGQ